MKFTIPSDSLVRALDLLAKIQMRTGVASSEYIRARIKKGRLVMTLASEVRGELSVKVDTDANATWEFFLDRSAFLPFTQLARSSAETAFTIVTGEKTATVSIGRRSAKFASVPTVAGYDLATLKETDVNLPEGFKNLLDAAERFATTDKTEEHMACVWSTGKALIASNVTSAVKIPVKLDYVGPLPLGVGTFFLDGAKVSAGKSGISIRYKNGHVFQAITAITRTKFPADGFLNSFKKAAALPKVLVMDGAKFARSIDYLRKCSEKEPDVAISFTGKKGDKIITASVESGAHFSERIRCMELPCDVNDEIRLKTLASLDIKKSVEVYFKKDSQFRIVVDGSTECLLGRKKGK